MGAWLATATGAARLVSERPAFWVPGALAWVASVGWLPLLVAVARPPTSAELTFLGARLVTSGAWPWNAVLIGVAATIIVLAAFAVVAVANAVLLGMIEGRADSVAGARRLLRIGLVAAGPGVAVFIGFVSLAAAIAPGAFNAPEGEGVSPVVRIAVRLAPLLVAFAAAVVMGSAFGAVAARSDDIRAGARRLAHLGAAGWVQVVVGTAVTAAFLLFAALLLSVLWAPIEVELGARGEFGLATVLLLVGFVAIWLCLVLAGGALHAWSATTWSRLLAAGPRPIHPPRS